MSKGRKRLLWLSAGLGLLVAVWAASWVVVANTKPEPVPAPADLPPERTARLAPESADPAGPEYRWRYRVTAPHYWSVEGGGDDDDKPPDRTLSLARPKLVKDWRNPRNLQFVELSFTVFDPSDGHIGISWRLRLARDSDLHSTSSDGGWSWTIKKCDLTKLVKPQVVAERTLPIPSKVALFVCEAEGVDGKPKRQTISLKLAE